MNFLGNLRYRDSSNIGESSENNNKLFLLLTILTIKRNLFYLKFLKAPKEITKKYMYNYFNEKIIT